MMAAYHERVGKDKSWRSDNQASEATAYGREEPKAKAK